MNQLESALVLRLRNVIRWESAVDEIPSEGTWTTGILQQVDSSDPFDPVQFQYRDRQLRYLDMVNAAAIVDVSVQVSDVWNFSTVKPVMEGPAPKLMPTLVIPQVTTSGTGSFVRHVTSTSIAYDAARYADNDLYTRDMLLHEVLARACAIFSDPPISPLDSYGTIIPSTGTWSLAEGLEAMVDINAALPLDKNLFKRPDQALADRDNLLAAYVARVVQALKNPFEYATRLYVEASSVEATEPEVYVLAQDGEERVWTAEPALPGRNRIVYNTATKTLQWFRERTDEVHIPQLFALSIPGILPGQTLDTLPQIPEPKDAQFWRQKAERVIPFGGSVSDALTLDFTASDAVTGGYMQIKASSLTVPDDMTLTLDGSLDAGTHRVCVLAVPNPVVEIAGASNTTGDTGIDGGATFEIEVPSGSITTKTYIVEGGDGITYNAVNYYPGQTFGGVSGVTTYSQLGVTSKVRQYSMAWKLALPPGAWKLTVDYTNLQHTTTGFGVGVNYATGDTVVEIIKDTAVLPFTTGNGTVVSSLEGAFDVLNGNEFSIPVYWSYGTGQLHVRKLTFENTDITNCRIAMSGSINTGEAVVDVVGTRFQPEILMFTLTNGVESPQTELTLRMAGTLGEDSILPLQIKQVTIQDAGTYNATINADGFQGWRQECLDRAELTISRAFNNTVIEYGARFPIFYSAGTAWGVVNTEDWMSIAEAQQPRLRALPTIASGNLSPGRQYEVITGPVTYDSTVYAVGEKFYAVDGETTFAGGTVDQIGAFQKSNPGHLGKPCLIPNGLSFNGSIAVLAVNGTMAVPTLAACQPWMVDLGFYTAQPEFWMPEQR